MLLACNAPSKDGLFGRSGAGGSLGGSGAGGSSGGSGGSEASGDAGGSSGSGGTGGSGQGGSGAAGAGGDLDAGADAADAASDPTLDAGPICSGTLVDELCWYLGEVGESCTDTCAERGGYDERGTPIIGSDDQGGSLEQCTLILEVLLNEAAETDNDNDGDGLGCHLRGNDEDRFRIENTDFSPDESANDARIACSCIE
jgi:hypothetical protein